MTVRQLRMMLEDAPDDAEVTDVHDISITKVGYEPDEENPERMIVWLDTDSVFEDDLK